MEFGEQAAQAVIDAGMDGVVTAADVVAAGLVRGLQKAGKSVDKLKLILH